MSRLSTDHARDAAGMKYVYAVVSRRSHGVSVGINLNPNNACNWRCIYCQVPELVRGKAPTIDLAQLSAELDRMLDDVVRGDLLETEVEAPLRRLNDVALSGNGESTTSRELPEVVELIAAALERFQLLGQTKLVLITNGSMIGEAKVQDVLRRMSTLNGEVWFKLDRATKDGLQLVNSVAMKPEDHLTRLRIAASLCPTWIQTCMFTFDGAPPSEHEVSAYLDALSALRAEAVPLRGVLLYGLARTSHQPEAPRLGRVSDDWLVELGSRIQAIGWPVTVTP